MSKVRKLFSNTEAEAEATQTGYSLMRRAVPEAFTIDGENRAITPPANFKYFGVESDEKSNRVYFECPQYVGDNIDLATCVIRINYKNANGVLDSYIVDDLESDGSNIRFSWSLGRNVTKYKGTVSFIVCATITDDNGGILTEWNTTLCKGEVLEGLEVDNPESEEEVSDLITQLVQMINKATDEVDVAKDKAIEDVDKAKDKAIEDIAKADYTLFANSIKTTVSDKGCVELNGVSPLAHSIKIKVSNFGSVAPGNCLIILEHYNEGTTKNIPITRNGTYSMLLDAYGDQSKVWIENTTTQEAEENCIIEVEYNKDLNVIMGDIETALDNIIEIQKNLMEVSE